MRELSAAGHSFRSASDCEVLVHGYEQWGLDGLLNRLRGMYAFLLYDARKKVCYAVRDGLGIKPLYYTVAADGRYAFASEVKAVVRAGFVEERTDRNALAGFLLNGSVPHPLTWRSGVRSVEPGSYIEISAAGMRTEMRTVRYRALQTAAAGQDADAGQVLTKAVNEHLISDAPLGIFLSSGVDSIGLLALARRAGVKPRTLTVIFDEKDHSEDTAAIARSYGAEHSEIRVTADDFMEQIPRFLCAMDQPTADGLNTFFVSKAAHDSGLKAVLSGLGGDGCFAATGITTGWQNTSGN
jgi:asparagine synthase (glutamine-hydrolysing)